MDEQDNEPVEETIEEETPETDLSAETDWEAEAKKARGIAQRLRTKLTKATEKKVEKVEAKAEPAKSVSNTGELDETQLDYLDLKGISDAEDIKVIEQVMKRTGESLRNVLKDDYVQTKLSANKAEREVKGATPGSTKRSGGQADTLDLALAKHARTGEMPSDFDLRTKMVAALMKKDSPDTPPWRR